MRTEPPEIPVFTPRLSPTSGERIEMNLNATDYGKIRRGKPWSAHVTDQRTGWRYLVRGAPCSAGERCFCDAEIVRVVSKGVRP
jgi:hypothetical protein